MDMILDLLLSKYQLFLLVMVRTSGIFIFSPFFSAQNIPNTMKVGLTFFISLLITSYLPITPDFNNEIILFVILKELMIGIIIGFISYSFFSIFYIMGQIMDMKIGFGMANVIDPLNRTQVPLMGNFYYILSFLLLMRINGHHLIISALVNSYDFLPIGSFKYTGDIVNILINSLAKSFEIGFKLSAPVVAIIFITDIVLGIISKTIPQMNVFVVGMPLKVIIGLLIIIISMPIFFTTIDSILDLIVNDIYKFIKM
ncbi:flagellar type III secretion system protein FliR [Tissierella pigra]|uniref:Flagellar biosynthetic protein FliR n=1 Tax=Tissierella pigra TaxID=2607614 RepID=A0A6N7XDA2_9FIRM|nr:flagellar biosynthetic protein FliR [Tissierella pigra]MBU5426546.1 flagellar type III secretion system protein FliR [Tissierella pigra]MSU00009.1 flagellar type III secretion system protein FliR [Tissierella pigra]